MSEGYLPNTSWVLKSTRIPTNIRVKIKENIKNPTINTKARTLSLNKTVGYLTEFIMSLSNSLSIFIVLLFWDCNELGPKVNA